MKTPKQTLVKRALDSVFETVSRLLNPNRLVVETETERIEIYLKPGYSTPSAQEIDLIASMLPDLLTDMRQSMETENAA